MSGLTAPGIRIQYFCKKKNMSGINDIEQSINKCKGKSRQSNSL